MTVFGSPLSELANNRELSDEDLIRALRFAATGEYEAAQTYMQLVDSSDNKLAAKVLKCVADEERVHNGGFPRFLYDFTPGEENPNTTGSKAFDRNQENEV